MSFERTRAAVAKYDAAKPELSRAYSASMTLREFRAAAAQEKVLVDEVRAAFFEDTKHVNSKDRAYLVHPDDPHVRRWLGQCPTTL